jgi:hypothetical protein
VINPEVRQSGKVNLRLDKFIHSIAGHYANPTPPELCDSIPRNTAAALPRSKWLQTSPLKKWI